MKLLSERPSVDAFPVDTGSQVEQIQGNRQFLKNIIFQILKCVYEFRVYKYASIGDEGATDVKLKP